MWAEIIDYTTELWADTRVRAGLIILGSVILAYSAEFIFRRIFVVIADRTNNELDDLIVDAVRRPLFWSVIFTGLSWANTLHYHTFEWLVGAIMKTILMVLWTMAIVRIAEATMRSLARRNKSNSLLQTDTLPVFNILAKLALISGCFYGIFLAWDIDVTAWLASAGIIGIAVGFAAQDTLANVIAGLVILADRPYRVGDFILLEQDETLRGKVTRVGLRSTRIQTLDNVEITVPNNSIGSSKILNEVGGPSVRQRIKTEVSVAYGSDVDRVTEVLQTCPEGMSGMCESPTPEARLIRFGASGLDFKVFVWIHEPARRDVILSELNKRIYKALGAADIEIPYTKHDVYIKAMPGTGSSTGIDSSD